MQMTEALSIVNNLIFRPEWKFRAAAAGYGRIYVEAVIRTVDTNCPPDYRVSKTIDPGAEIDIERLDEDGLIYAIKTRVIEPVNDHEDREFLRRGDLPGYEAPFHPHHPEGELRWAIQQAKDARKLTAAR
jgi:hypothetical protein